MCLKLVTFLIWEHTHINTCRNKANGVYKVSAPAPAPALFTFPIAQNEGSSKIIKVGIFTIRENHVYICYSCVDCVSIFVFRKKKAAKQRFDISFIMKQACLVP